MKPTEAFDVRGVPIYPGDLIRFFHFTGARRKRYYLYHVAVVRGGRMWLVPTAHLEPTKSTDGGSCLLLQSTIDGYEGTIISGYGPGDCLDYSDRPKRKP